MKIYGAGKWIDSVVALTVYRYLWCKLTITNKCLTWETRGVLLTLNICSVSQVHYWKVELGYTQAYYIQLYSPSHGSKENIVN